MNRTKLAILAIVSLLLAIILYFIHVPTKTDIGLRSKARYISSAALEKMNKTGKNVIALSELNEYRLLPDDEIEISTDGTCFSASGEAISLKSGDYFILRYSKSRLDQSKALAQGLISCGGGACFFCK